MAENIIPTNRYANDKLLSLQKSLRIESEKLDVLSSQVHLMQQQLDLYQHEEKIAKDKIKKALDEFTKDMCQSLTKNKKPTDDVKSICDIFLLLLNIQERNWLIFKELGKNYISLKTLMTGLKLEAISNTSIESALPLWKNYSTLSSSLKKNYKGASILLDWITSVVEWRLKNETMKSLELRFPDFQKQVHNQLNLIANLKGHIIEVEQSRSKLSQGSFSENNRSQGRLEYKISSPISKKIGDLEDLMTAQKSPGNDPFKLKDENYVLHTETTNATQKLTLRKPFQTDPNTYTQRIAEEDVSDSSIFFDLDINSSENMTGFRDVLKPKPKILTQHQREATTIRNSMIIMNNLQFMSDGGNMMKETFVEDPAGNVEPNKGKFEEMNQDIKEMMKVVLSPTNKSKENPSNLRKIQEINSDFRRANMVDGSNETIICCGKSFHNRFFCA